MKRSKLEIGIALLVSAIWSGSIIADFYSLDWEPSPFIHFAMMGILGAIFGKQYFQNGNGGGR